MFRADRTSNHSDRGTGRHDRTRPTHRFSIPRPSGLFVRYHTSAFLIFRVASTTTTTVRYDYPSKASYSYPSHSPTQTCPNSILAFPHRNDNLSGRRDSLTDTNPRLYSHNPICTLPYTSLQPIPNSGGRSGTTTFPYSQTRTRT